ncbi:MAG TPA: hypothetical protein VF729_01165, partial [Solirubrobacterales bacterium]
DGGRLFFNSYEGLVPNDTNGATDVYQWEAPGSGSCTKESYAYQAANGGCIHLISSGESPADSEFRNASADGRDVYFITESSLLPQDPGLIDLYDARVGGGFSQPTERAACEGEACQGSPPPPLDPTPASTSYRGPGNLAPGGSKARCPKGKRRVARKGGTRCVKRGKRRSRQRKANHERRQSR